MDYFVICFVAAGAAALTLFSGFGLGTVLLPAFALFVPAAVAVAATAVVHLANNLFKIMLVGRDAQRATVLRFGIPAVLGGLAGAALLGVLAGRAPLSSYSLAGHRCEVTPVKLVIGMVILVSAVIELVPSWRGRSFEGRHLVIGGILSGFFGGLSGQQGALRSAFLLKAGLTKEQFIGTGVIVAVMVDTARLLVYGAGFMTVTSSDFSPRLLALLLCGTVAAFAGSYLGARLVRKVTLRTVQIAVGVLLAALGIALGLGVV